MQQNRYFLCNNRLTGYIFEFFKHNNGNKNSGTEILQYFVQPHNRMDNNYYRNDNFGFYRNIENFYKHQAGTGFNNLKIKEKAMAIVVNLDVMMAKRKISLNELSEKVDITPANLSILKTGKAKAIRFSTLEAICKELDCQPSDILEYR